MKKSKLYIWEIALMAALCISLAAGAHAGAEQEALADKMVRLHVIARSDAEEDQRVKLLVRDAVLAELTPLLETAEDAFSARDTVAGALQRVADTAAAVSGLPVTVTLGPEDYPTREYDGFSLPAGRYTSLRVVLGEGAGRNWWCVVFPPLCLSAAEASFAETFGLTDNEFSLITEENPGWEVRFRIVELWDELRRFMGGI